MARPLEDKNPVVIGRLGRCPDRPTVTFYGHYDVQPAMERDWKTDPFEMQAIDGYLYGRGTSDNKASGLPSADATLHGLGLVALPECVPAISAPHSLLSARLSVRGPLNRLSTPAIMVVRFCCISFEAASASWSTVTQSRPLFSKHPFVDHPSSMAPCSRARCWHSSTR
jgi:Peptidase family M20/M25/M40